MLVSEGSFCYRANGLIWSNTLLVEYQVCLSFSEYTSSQLQKFAQCILQIFLILYHNHSLFLIIFVKIFCQFISFFQVLLYYLSSTEVNDSHTLLFYNLFSEVSIKSSTFLSLERFSKALFPLKFDIAFLIFSLFALLKSQTSQRNICGSNMKMLILPYMIL